MNFLVKLVKVDEFVGIEQDVAEGEDSLCFAMD